MLVVLFGSSSWLSTNSVWMQLPLLTEQLPEHWNLPSYLVVIVQVFYELFRCYFGVCSEEIIKVPNFKCLDFGASEVLLFFF